MLTTTIIAATVTAAVLVLSVIDRQVTQRALGARAAWYELERYLGERNWEVAAAAHIARTYIVAEDELFTQLLGARSAAHQARRSADVEQIADAEEHLRRGVALLAGLQETYQRLSGDPDYRKRLARIETLQHYITRQTRVYNEWVAASNADLARWPHRWLAKAAGVRHRRACDFRATDEWVPEIAALACAEPDMALMEHYGDLVAHGSQIRADA